MSVLLVLQPDSQGLHRTLTFPSEGVVPPAMTDAIAVDHLLGVVQPSNRCGSKERLHLPDDCCDTFSHSWQKLPTRVA